MAFRISLPMLLWSIYHLPFINVSKSSLFSLTFAQIIVRTPRQRDHKGRSKALNNERAIFGHNCNPLGSFCFFFRTEKVVRSHLDIFVTLSLLHKWRRASSLQRTHNINTVRSSALFSSIQSHLESTLSSHQFHKVNI